MPVGSVLKKKKKSPIPESRVPETGSDPPIGSGPDSGHDKRISLGSEITRHSENRKFR